MDCRGVLEIISFFTCVYLDVRNYYFELSNIDFVVASYLFLLWLDISRITLTKYALIWMVYRVSQDDIGYSSGHCLLSTVLTVYILSIAFYFSVISITYKILTHWTYSNLFVKVYYILKRTKSLYTSYVKIWHWKRTYDVIIKCAKDKIYISRNFILKHWKCWT